jgi:hypothetical protein
VFGSQVARALPAWGTPLTIAGQEQRQAATFANYLGGDCLAAGLDILPHRDACYQLTAAGLELVAARLDPTRAG